MTLRIEADWLADPALQRLLATLGEGGEEARVVGGAVRNHLMHREIADVDIATTCLPEETARRAAVAGFRAIPTGLAHGTITAVAPGGRAYEVTTLREDVSTDGRHAAVRFGRDWRTDAARRDFTINALYCDARGKVLDLVGGVADVETGTLRFIGDAAGRIEEDYLRILRFFRFFAWYGSGRPDGEGLRACARLKGGLSRLSAERVWSELRKLLAAPDPSRALLWMRQAGVLTQALPESERWGIDAVHGLVAAERALGWPADPLRRLQAIVPPDAARLEEMTRRLKTGKSDRDRLAAWALADPANPAESDAAFRVRLYLGNPAATADRLALAVAAERVKAEGDPSLLPTVATLVRRFGEADAFTPPALPVSGHDLAEHGVPAGPQTGQALARLRRIFAESGFTSSREALLARLS